MGTHLRLPAESLNVLGVNGTVYISSGGRVHQFLAARIKQDSR
ncbi:unnamed protein product [Ixodes persulcatus]